MKKAMRRQLDLGTSLEAWQAGFLKDAEADKLKHFRAHLKAEGLGDDAEQLVEGTVLVAQVGAVYLNMDGRPFEEYLRMQTYDAAAAGAVYSLTFKLMEGTYARILIGAKLAASGIDLADLLGHPWPPYRVCGYRSVSIARIDRRRLTKLEKTSLIAQITYDLSYDYPEDRLSFDFDDFTRKDVLTLYVTEYEPGERKAMERDYLESLAASAARPQSPV